MSFHCSPPSAVQNSLSLVETQPVVGVRSLKSVTAGEYGGAPIWTGLLETGLVEGRGCGRCRFKGESGSCAADPTGNKPINKATTNKTRRRCMRYVSLGYAVHIFNRHCSRVESRRTSVTNQWFGSKSFRRLDTTAVGFTQSVFDSIQRWPRKEATGEARLPANRRSIGQQNATPGIVWSFGLGASALDFLYE
jgi:hypothetical protein